MKLIISNKKAFTLVELLVVITIVGILAVVAIPTVGGMTARARSTEGVAMLGTFRNIQRSYFIEHGNYGSLMDLADNGVDFEELFGGRYYGTMGGAYGGSFNWIIKLDGINEEEGEWVEMDDDGTIRQSCMGDTSALN